MAIAVITVTFSIKSQALTSIDHGDSWQECVESGKCFFFKRVCHMLDDIIDTDNIDSVKEKIEITLTEGQSSIAGYEVNQLGTIMTEVNDICKMVAGIICICTFFMSIINMRTSETTDEELLRRFIILVMCFALCINAMRICFVIINSGTEISKLIMEKYTLVASDQQSVIDSVKAVIYTDCHQNKVALNDGTMHPFDEFGAWISDNINNMMTSVGYWVQLIPGWLCMRITGIVISVICWSRALEALVISIFSPLSFANALDSSHIEHSDGIRFIKNVIAIGISGAIIMVVMIIANGVIFEILSTSFTGIEDMNMLTDAIWPVIVIGFAECGMAMKAGQIAKTVCGVG